MFDFAFLKTAPMMILIACAMLALTWAHGFHTGQQHERTAAQARLVATMNAIADRAAELAKDDAEKLAQAEQKRRQTQADMAKLSEQVTDYVATYSPLDDCSLDDRGLQLWNASNAGTAAKDRAGAEHGAMPAASAGEVGKTEGPAAQPRAGGGDVSHVQR